MKKDNNEKKENKKNNKGYYFFMFLIILVFILVLWSRYISTKGLVVREYAVINERIPKSFEGFKIIHFTDLHYGTTIFEEELENLINNINDLNPDIVIFTGDLIDKRVEITEEDVNIVTNELNRVDAKIGKYAVKGNHDYQTIYFDAVMEQTDFKVLNNSSELIYYEGKTPIYLVGIDDLLKGNPDYSIINNDNNYYSILITHEPDTFDNVKDKNFDLILAGHSHNGQVRFPLLGSLYKVKGAKKYYDPHYIINNTELFISGGLGTSKYKFRFLNKPSFNFYRLYND